MSVYSFSIEGQELYIKIYNAITAHQLRIDIPSLSDDFILAVYNKVLSENSEGLFYKVGSIRIVPSWNKKTLLLSQTDDKQMMGLLNKIISERNKIIKLASANRDLYGVILTIYDYFVKNYNYADYDSEQFHQIYSPLLNNKAVCDGFAMLFSEILNSMKIPCGVISGTSNRDGKRDPHSWNIVKYNGKYYHLDVTWDICIKDQKYSFYDYFMLDDDLILCDHSWDDDSIPECIDSSKEYYAKINALCRCREDVVHLLVNSIKSRCSIIGFRFRNSSRQSYVNDSFVRNVINDSFRICNKAYSNITYQINETAKTVVFEIKYR